MSEKVLYFTSDPIKYSENVKKLIHDINDEVIKGIKDGFAYKLASVENDEAKLYAFLKNEGYDITYKEFTGFINDCKDTIKLNEQFIHEATSEHSSVELSDSDLEQVAGGMNWWQWLLVGIGAALVTAAIILTAGLATPLIAAAATGVAVTGATVAGFVGAAAGVAVTAAVAGGVGIASAAVGGITAAAGVK